MRKAETLLERMRRAGPIPLAALHPLALQAWTALHDLHNMGALHGDIRPVNLLLEPSGSGEQLSLIDHGDDLTATGQGPSAFHYMAPEQIGKSKPAGARADIYALSSVLFEALTGQLPHEGRTPPEQIRSKNSREARRAGEVTPALGGAPIEVFFARGLMRNPEERFESALAALQAWRALLQSHTDRDPAEEQTVSGPSANEAPALPFRQAPDVPPPRLPLYTHTLVEDPKTATGEPGATEAASSDANDLAGLPFSAADSVARSLYASRQSDPTFTLPLAARSSASSVVSTVQLPAGVNIDINRSLPVFMRSAEERPGAPAPAPPVRPESPAPEVDKAARAAPAPHLTPAPQKASVRAPAPVAPAARAAPVAAAGEASEEHYPITRCARIAASCAHKPEGAAAVLERHGLTAASFAALEKRWAEAIQDESAKGASTLLIAYDDAYVAQLEAERGPVTVQEYARLLVAIERLQADRALAELLLPKGAKMRIQRVWLRRLAQDAALGKAVRVALSVEAKRSG